ncbi:uncharacterized protein UDID_18152 [Ustilago sp. UG-2017a]|nr:uncharacterized protein UDID_18152 [Ustilago sp. UG-2017a]
MVLLSALVLLLLPALLCHAAPHPVAASSSSVSPDPAFNAESIVPGDRLGIKDFGYYYDLQPKPKMRTLTKEEFAKQFGTQIHIEGSPVLFSKKVDESKVHHALEHYGKVWMVGPSTDFFGYPESMLLENKIKKGKVTIKQVVSSKPNFDPLLAHVQLFGEHYGEKALYLTYGRPFAKPKKSRLRFLRFLRSFGYKKPDWNEVPTSGLHDLEEEELAYLRTRLQDEKYLGVRDSKNRLLGFALDKDGTVLFKDFSERVRV